MNDKCYCKPGKQETGWQEIRSTACVQREKDAFSRAAKVPLDNLKRTK